MRFVERKAEVKTFIMIASTSSLTNTAALVKEKIVFRNDSIHTVLEKKDCNLLQIIVYFYNLNII
jgi:hypothetical protein